MSEPNEVIRRCAEDAAAWRARAVAAEAERDALEARIAAVEALHTMEPTETINGWDDPMYAIVNVCQECGYCEDDDGPLCPTRRALAAPVPAPTPDRDERSVEILFPTNGFTRDEMGAIFEAFLDGAELLGCEGGHGSLRTGRFSAVFAPAAAAPTPPPPEPCANPECRNGWVRETPLVAGAIVPYPCPSCTVPNPGDD